MNNDVFIDERPEGVVEAYRALSAAPQLGAVGVVLLFEDGTVQHGGVEFLQTPELFAVPYHPGTRQLPVHKMGEVFTSSAVTGAFLMTSSLDQEDLTSGMPRNARILITAFDCVESASKSEQWMLARFTT
jgi:hypothetical protein